MYRYKLLIEFDGRPFVGWQRQQNGPSVQEALETAIARFCQEKVSSVAAGRTDAGVHARGMCVHIDLARFHAPDTIKGALNHHLKPNPIAVLNVVSVDQTFHARFSATARHYIYRIFNRRAPLTLDRGKFWRVSGDLDARRMHDAGQALIGKHDFTTFRAAQCQARSPVKTLSTLSVDRSDEIIEISVSAPSFLHHQVRSIAGTLIEVGLGRWSCGDVEKALHATDRKRCGQVAPPDGLYFMKADYGRLPPSLAPNNRNESGDSW